jgi:hypothetical protein
MTFGRDERNGRFSNLFGSVLSNPALSQKLHYLYFLNCFNISRNFEIKAYPNNMNILYRVPVYFFSFCTLSRYLEICHTRPTWTKIKSTQQHWEWKLSTQTLRNSSNSETKRNNVRFMQNNSQKYVRDTQELCGYRKQLQRRACFIVLNMYCVACITNTI